MDFRSSSGRYARSRHLAESHPQVLIIAPGTATTTTTACPLDLAPVNGEYHSTQYVSSLMKQQGLPAYGHDIGEHFAIGSVGVEVTPADHSWQNESPGASDRIFEPEDCCGFWIDSPDGTIWAPGDSRLIPDHHLRMPAADAILFDFSDSEWHFGLDGAIAMANAYPHPIAAAPLGRPASPSCCGDCRVDQLVRTQAAETSFATMIADMARGQPA